MIKQARMINKMPVLLTGCGIFLVLSLFGQGSQVVYSVDPDFSSGNIFNDGCSPVIDIEPIENNKFIIGGGFTESADNINPFTGIGKINADGSEGNWPGGGMASSGVGNLIAHQGDILFSSNTRPAKYTTDGYNVFVDEDEGLIWGEYYYPESNYNYRYMHNCFYVQDDDKVLMGGAVATDTTQPNLFRHLFRVMPDGTHDPTFPPIEAEPNKASVTSIRDIFKDPNGGWVVSGYFDSLNGHPTYKIARLTEDFQVDTSFTSPFQSIVSTAPTDRVRVILVDNVSRIWVSGQNQVLIDSPDDTLDVARLLPDGSIDETFLPRKLKGEYPDHFVHWSFNRLEGALDLNNNGHYMLYGFFSHFNDTLQNCITVVDDAGIIQPGYFPGSVVTQVHCDEDETRRPGIYDIEELEDGSLIIGGRFSDFDGIEHHNVVKLKRGTVSTNHIDQRKNTVKVFPNPADDHITVEMEDFHQPVPFLILNSLGIEVMKGKFTMQITSLALGKLPNGLYFIQIPETNKSIRFVKGE